MHKLKELRTGAGYTQKELAAKLGTTQQTVARWESNQTAIPSASLRDIATLFGSSVDDLLGVERPSQSQISLFLSDDRVPFGFLTADFGFASRQYPVDETQRHSFGDALRSDFSFEGLKGWMAFATLANQLVFLNPATLRHLSLMGASPDVMPPIASPSAFRSLTLPTPADQVSPTVANERQQLIKQLAPGERDPLKALVKAERELASLKVLFDDGSEIALYLSDEIVRGIALLERHLKNIGPNAFAVSRDELDLHLINLSKVAALEVPLEAYRAFLSKDGADDG